MEVLSLTMELEQKFGQVTCALSLLWLCICHWRALVIVEPPLSIYHSTAAPVLLHPSLAPLRSLRKRARPCCSQRGGLPSSPTCRGRWRARISAPNGSWGLPSMKANRLQSVCERCQNGDSLQECVSEVAVSCVCLPGHDHDI